jgi:hypothetical protein
MAHKREYFRIAIDRTGSLQRRGETVLCHVVNLNEKGLQLRVEGSFAPGEILYFEFALTERDFLACTIRVTYARPPFIGTVIVSISSRDQTLLSHFIDEVNAITLRGF